MAVDRIISLDNEGQWREALQDVPHGIGHTWEHRHALYLSAPLNTFLYSFADAGSRFICCFSERHCESAVDIFSPPGFSGFVGRGNSRILKESWRRAMEERGYVCGYISLHPGVSDPAWFGSEVQTYGAAYTMDLRPPLNEVYARFSRNRKREIQHAETSGIRVWIGSSAAKQFFVRHFMEACRRRGAAEAYHLSPNTLSVFCELDNYLVVGAGHTEVESVTVFAFTPFAAESLYNVSFSAERSFSTILTWTAIKELHARKIPLLNLGAGYSPYEGIGEYKRRFGTRETPMYCLKQVYEPGTFSRLCSLAGVSPDDLNGFFPPYRRRPPVA